MRLDYFEINQRAVNQLLSVKKHVGNIDARLKALIELRVSQINGCVYCVDLHANEARELGETQQRLDCLSVWKESEFFDARERLALQWAESVTHTFPNGDRDAQLESLREHFSDIELVDLTITVSMMNCLNRLAIACGDRPEARPL